MMHLGFVSAILGDLSLEEVVAYAAEERFACVEPMCWPPGGSDRRYAGVCHLDAAQIVGAKDPSAAGSKVRSLFADYGIAISGLGYYPNPLDPDPAHRRVVIDHLKKVITAASLVGAHVVNTFIGRDPNKNIDENFVLVLEVWPEIVRHAEEAGVHLGIENCPMLFSKDEWPGGKNLAVSPAIWRKLFDELRSSHVGLNFDPSHLVWQHIDYVRCIREFAKRIFHVHAKDTRVDVDKLYEHGSLGLGWHTAKIPGLGDVNWGQLFSALTDTGYKGSVCIEVEDRAYEGSLADRKRALKQSKRYLEQFMA